MSRTVLGALFSSVAFIAFHAQAAAPAAPALDADDIGGVVSSTKGAEAGVWVIAETSDTLTPMIKIVVTDSQGRYVLPDMPAAKYSVWVRGYGLVDSKSVEASPGARLNLTAVAAPDRKAAAQIYPPNYWYALLEIPGKENFPGTGPQGNGIPPVFQTQQQWRNNVKEGCIVCHAIGNQYTRELPTSGDLVEAWDQRITKNRNEDDVTLGHRAKSIVNSMSNGMTRLGRGRALQMYADWTDRIAKGALPTEDPPRPAGPETNMVITLWDWAGGHFAHDEITTDRRNPTVNAGGPIYGTDDFNGHLVQLDPVTMKPSEIPIPGTDRAHNNQSGVHNPKMDSKGRVWLTRTHELIEDGEGKANAPDYCVSPSNKFAKHYPMPSKFNRQIAFYDPANKRYDLIPVCFGTHHLEFSFEKEPTLFMSGDVNVVGWIDTKTYDATRDAGKAVGWCPMVLESNGDGKVELDRTKWNEPRDQADPNKDTRISGFLYGMGINPKDASVWFAIPSRYPTGIVRFDRGANPPQTCHTEFFEPPRLANGDYAAFNARGVDIDSNGVGWVALGSGHMGRFDRAACKVTTGKGAVGQQCPEGWTFFDSPGPKMKETGAGSADWHYLTWVDHHNVFGLGKDTPFMPGSNSDSLLAFLPETKKFVVMRVPYPMGFYSRGLDARIDDPKTGWKGRAVWANYGTVALWHTETGEGTFGKVVKFQYRPDPLAH